MNEENKEILDQEVSSAQETEVVDNNVDQEQPKMFTQEDVDKMINKRLAKEKAKQEKALKEAERLSKLSEDERVKAQLEADRAAFEEERSAYLREKMLTACEKELISNKLPVEFANLLITDDADSTSDNIKAFKEKWNNALEEAVNERLKSSAKVPKIQPTENNGKVTWDDVLRDPSLLKKYQEQN